MVEMTISGAFITPKTLARSSNAELGTEAVRARSQPEFEKKKQ